jgi:hypothetical protein
VEYSKKRAEYFEKTDPKLLRAINKARVAKGKSRIRYKGPPRPHTNFIKFVFLPSPLVKFRTDKVSFLAEFRASPAGRELIAREMEGDKKVIPAIARAGAALWSTYTQEEKDVCVYHQRYITKYSLPFFAEIQDATMKNKLFYYHSYLTQDISHYIVLNTLGYFYYFCGRIPWDIYFYAYMPSVTAMGMLFQAIRILFQLKEQTIVIPTQWFFYK